MIFGSKKDFNLITNINKELLHNVIEQEILYYKPSLTSSETDLYGESSQKVFNVPIKLNCLIERQEVESTDNSDLVDITRTPTFRFLREDLENIELVPEMGDIVEWERNYYEVETVKEHEYFLGRNSDYNLTEYGSRFGSSLSIIVQTHLTKADRIGIEQVR